MDRHTYLKQFSRAVRWRLPKKEADDVISDYAELLARRPNGTDGTLVEELGEPVQAARLLAEPRDYRLWLAAFSLMAACILLPELMLLRARRGGWSSEELILALLLAGTAAALVKFRPVRGEEKKKLPRGLLPLLAAVLVMPLAAGAVLWGLATGAWEALPPGSYGSISTWALCIAGTAAGAAAIWGLVKARMSDRRWRALYVLGLAALVECTLVLLLLSSMSLDSSLPDWWVEYALRWAAVGAVGLVGAGVSLC